MNASHGLHHRPNHAHTAASACTGRATGVCCRRFPVRPGPLPWLHFAVFESYYKFGFGVGNVRSIKNGSWNIEGTGVNQGCSGCSPKHRGDPSSTVEVLGPKCKTARRTSDFKRKSSWNHVLRWSTVGIHIIYYGQKNVNVVLNFSKFHSNER